MSLASPNKAFYLILVTFVFAISLLLSLLTKMAPLTVSHTLFMCQKTISDLVITIPHSTPFVLALMGGLIATLGTVLFLFKLYATLKFIKVTRNNQIELPSKVVKITKQLNILNKVEVVKSNSFSSFCFGFLNPRICVSSQIVSKLTTKQLKAILIHESYHLKNKDPLKIFLSQIASSMFFFIPIFKDIKDFYILSKEIAADQLVVSSNYAKGLRQALLKTLVLQPQFVGVASFVSNNDYEQRILLLTRKQAANIQFSFFRLAISIMVFLMAFILVSLPVYAVEDSKDSHTYLICPFGSECAMSCKQEGIIQEKPFSESSNFSPMMYSSKTNP